MKHWVCLVATLGVSTQLSDSYANSEAPCELNNGAIHGIRAGMPLHELRTRFGLSLIDGRVSLGGSDFPSYIVKDEQGRPLFEATYQNRRLLAVWTEHPECKTQRGISVGSDGDELRAAWGKFTTSESGSKNRVLAVFLQPIGYTVHLDANQVVTRIYSDPLPLNESFAFEIPKRAVATPSQKKASESKESTEALDLNTLLKAYKPLQRAEVNLKKIFNLGLQVVPANSVVQFTKNQEYWYEQRKNLMTSFERGDNNKLAQQLAVETFRRIGFLAHYLRRKDLILPMTWRVSKKLHPTMYLVAGQIAGSGAKIYLPNKSLTSTEPYISFNIAGTRRLRRGYEVKFCGDEYEYSVEKCGKEPLLKVSFTRRRRMRAKKIIEVDVNGAKNAWLIPSRCESSCTPAGITAYIDKSAMLTLSLESPDRVKQLTMAEIIQPHIQ